MEHNDSARHPGMRAFGALPFEFGDAQAVSAQTMQAHIGLYMGYVKQTNVLVEQQRQLLGAPDGAEAAALREHLARRLSFEMNGLVLHEALFEQLEGEVGMQGPDPGSEAMEAMDCAFGGFNAWRNDIRRLGQVRGVGWVIGAWNPETRWLTNSWIDLHHLGLAAGHRLVFVLDLWEHAFWSDYGAQRRAEYVEAALNHTNWSCIEQRVAPRLSSRA